MSNPFVLPLQEVNPQDAPPPEEFNAAAIGEKLKRETTVFEIHIRRPGFTKPIPPAEFIRKIKAAGEQALTPEQEVVLAQYRMNMVESVGPNGEHTDTNMLRVSQDILDRKEIGKIVAWDDRFSAWIKAQSIPSPYLASGLYQIFRYRVKEIDTAVIKFVQHRRKLIKALGEKYLQLQQEAEQRRWPFYDPNDYPTWAIIEAKYGVQARYVTYNVDEAIKEINEEIYQREEQKIKLEWANAAEEARQMQRQMFQELLDHFVTMLGRDEKGKRRSLRPTAVKKLQEFLKTFDEMNFTNDQELKAVINQVREVVGGVELDSLKKDMTLRDTLETAVGRIKEQTASMVVVRERKVVFEDFEVEDEPAEIETAEEDALPLN